MRIGAFSMITKLCVDLCLKLYSSLHRPPDSDKEDISSDRPASLIVGGRVEK